MQMAHKHTGIMSLFIYLEKVRQYYVLLIKYRYIHLFSDQPSWQVLLVSSLCNATLGLCWCLHPTQKRLEEGRLCLPVPDWQSCRNTWVLQIKSRGLYQRGHANIIWKGGVDLNPLYWEILGFVRSQVDLDWITLHPELNEVLSKYNILLTSDLWEQTERTSLSLENGVFVCLDVCVPCACLIPTETRGRHQIPRNYLWIFVSHHVGVSNWTQSLGRAASTLDRLAIFSPCS